MFLVLYKYNTTDPNWKDKIYDMKTYGAYNNRHIFLCYSVRLFPLTLQCAH